MAETATVEQLLAPGFALEEEQQIREDHPRWADFSSGVGPVVDPGAAPGAPPAAPYGYAQQPQQAETATVEQLLMPGFIPEGQ